MLRGFVRKICCVVFLAAFLNITEESLEQKFLITQSLSVTDGHNMTVVQNSRILLQFLGITQSLCQRISWLFPPAAAGEPSASKDLSSIAPSSGSTAENRKEPQKSRNKPKMPSCVARISCPRSSETASADSKLAYMCKASLQKLWKSTENASKPKPSPVRHWQGPPAAVRGSCCLDHSEASYLFPATS